VLRAQFSAQDHNSQIVIYIYQVIHKFAPSTVMNGQQSGAGAIAQLSHGVPRGDPLTANERRWLAPIS